MTLLVRCLGDSSHVGISIRAAIISSTYASDIGLSEAEAEKLCLRMLDNEILRNKLSVEVNLAFHDNSFSWLDFFEIHNVYSAENEDATREYARKIILAPLQTKLGAN